MYKSIQSLKDEARSLVGKQLYLRDKPHLTLYVGRFENVSSFQEKLARLVGTFGRTSFSVDDWLVFADDPVTKRDTLACGIDTSSISGLREIQDKVIGLLNRHRKKGLIRRYGSAYSMMDAILRKNCDEFGYPFVGEIWKPHFGIASFEHKAFINIWERMKEKCPVGTYAIASLTVYGLDEESEVLTRVRNFKF